MVTFIVPQTLGSGAIQNFWKIILIFIFLLITKFMIFHFLITGSAIGDRNPSCDLRPLGWNWQKAIGLADIPGRCGDAATAAGWNEPEMEPLEIKKHSNQVRRVKEEDYYPINIAPNINSKTRTRSPEVQINYYIVKYIKFDAIFLKT